MVQTETDPNFLKEVWAEYALGTTVLLVRFAVRIKTVGVRQFEGDDYFAMLVLVFWTLDAVLVQIVYYAGSNVDVTEAVLESITASEIARLEYGSKCQLVAWYTYTALIWCMKGTMLCFFKRLTFGLWHTKMVKFLAIACIVSYLAVVATLTFGCFPTHRNWQVAPNPGSNCTLKKQNFLVAAVLNVLTDAGLLAIPLPLLWKLKVPIRQKIVIGLLLSSGVFVITAAIIRVIFSLSNKPSGITINSWGVRETIVGMFTVNIPILRPIFTYQFWDFLPFTFPTLRCGSSTLYELSSSAKSTKKSQHSHMASTTIGGGAVKRMEGRERGSVAKGVNANASHEFMFNDDAMNNVDMTGMTMPAGGVFEQSPYAVEGSDIERGKAVAWNNNEDEIQVQSTNAKR